MRVLVTGATGFIGRTLVPRLVAAGDDVVALVRRPDAPVAAGAVAVRGDVTDADALRRACAGVQAVVHLANASGAADARLVEAVNVEGTRKLLHAAREAGVGRLVFTSSISASRARLGPYGATKRRAEDAVRASGLPSVILRPSLVYGDLEAGLVASLARYLRTLPVVPVIGNGRIELDPVYVDDLCALIVECLTRDDVLGKAYDVLGPERLTFDEFLRRLAAALGVRRPLLHVPGPAALAIARLLGRVTTRPPLTVDNVIGLTSRARVDPAPLARDFALPWTPLSTGLQAMMARAR